MKLTNEQVRYIYTTDESSTVLAERFDVHVGTIFAIRRGSLRSQVTDGLERPTRYRRKALKLSDADVEQIRSSNESLSTLARRFGVDPSMVSRIKNGNRRTDV